jgi:hypothetical protein
MSRAAAHEPRVARLTVDQVNAMIETGILRDGEPIEHIDGVLVYKDRSAHGEDPMTIGKRHNLVVKLLARLDAELAPHGFHMQTQGPLRLPPHDEPEPDGAILRGDPRAYTDRLPGAADAACVIEVADASLENDRTRKLGLYARAGVARYVIVNLRDGCVEVYEAAQREEGRYADVTVLRGGQSLTLDLDGAAVAIDVTRILP